MELSLLYPYLETYKSPAIFLGAFLFGETIILSAVFLAIENSWSLLLVFILSFLGTLIADIMWFVAGGYFLHKIKSLEALKEKHSVLLNKLQGQGPLRQAYYLLFFKFLYGTRIVTIMYVAIQNMPFWMFLLFDALGTLIWLSIIMLVGKVAWEGATEILQIFNVSQYALGAAFFLLVFYKLITLWLAKQNEK